MVPTKNARTIDRVPARKERDQYRRTPWNLITLLAIIFLSSHSGTCFGQVPSSEATPSAEQPNVQSPESNVYDSPFLKGDRVAFIGDSITQAGTYVDTLYLFYATRFPKRRFAIKNLGTRGETVPSTLAQFENDIASYKPTVAAIMLGMNDAWDACFGDGPPSTEQLALQRKAIQTYTDNIQRLTGSLRDIECHRVLIKPSIYDETTQSGRPILRGKNEMLRQFGVFLDLLAANESSDVIDCFGAMSQVNQHLQTRDPTATVIGPDRIHPNLAGHFVMAYAFLKSFDTPNFVSRISINVTDPRKSKQLNCEVSELNVEADTIGFQCIEKSLPFPVLPAHRPALQWTGFHQEYNRQVLSIVGLKPGRYALAVDGQRIGIWPASSFAQGINLCAHPLMPQLQQATKAMSFNQKRAAIAGQLKSVAFVQHRMLGQRKETEVVDQELLKQQLNSLVEQSPDKPWFQKQIDIYWKLLPELDAKREAMEVLDNQIWETVQPKTHRWQIQRID